MVATKSAADIAKKWAEVTPGRASYYAAGAAQPRTSWQQASAAAKGNFKASISAADIDARYAGGVARAGDAGWQQGIRDKGAARYGPGVQAATAKMQAAVEPFTSTIASTQLPPRQPRGSAANYARVQAIGDALSKKRAAMRAGGR